MENLRSQLGTLEAEHSADRAARAEREAELARVQGEYRLLLLSGEQTKAAHEELQHEVEALRRNIKSREVEIANLSSDVTRRKERVQQREGEVMQGALPGAVELHRRLMEV